MSRYLILCLFISLLVVGTGCTDEEKADLVIINGNVVTMDSEQPTAQAVAMQGQRIAKVGDNETVKKWIGKDTKVIDAKNAFVMPGFIEGHGHYTGIGSSLINLNLLNSKNWKQIVSQVKEKVKGAEPGEWIIGRGWHQEKWDEALERQIEGYPLHDELSAISPDNPVLLKHASGHGSFANKKAMDIAGISKETPDASGGHIVRDSRGEAIGVFEERAQEVLWDHYDAYYDQLSKEGQKKEWIKEVKLAEQECLSKGITSFQDAGSSYEDIAWFKEMAENGDMNLRLWAMLRHSYKKMKDNMDGLPIVNAGNHFFTVKAIKTEVDGALGARGAWLLEHYSDKPGHFGQNTTTIEEIRNIADLAYENNMQLCVHAIGDRANRIVLDIMELNFNKNPDNKDLRWRIEHAQHLNPDDIPRFKDLGVIASMQGIHCTSDAPFVVDRLGEERARVGAYAWRTLLDNGVVIANGTDAPVEDVDPIASFYASVSRKRVDNGMVFYAEQSMTREEALYSYTLGNAYAAFEEKDKGSLEEGKLADVVILSNDLLKCKEEEIMNTKVLATIVGSKVKWSDKQWLTENFESN